MKEINPDSVCRPERFILPKTNGVVVPVCYLSDDGSLNRQWFWYIQHRNGKREQIGVSSRHKFEDEIWFEPSQLKPPTGNQHSRWSQESRRDWLAENRSSIDVGQTYQNLLDAFDRFLEFPDEDRDGTLNLLACYVVLTYSYHVWPAVPYLFVNGMKNSGKSTVLNILSKLVFHPFKASSISTASIFRTLNEIGGTLLYDEAEQLKSPNADETRSILLAGYQNGATAARMEKQGNKFVMQEYCVYGPKVIACINSLPDALCSRCIEISMARAPKGSPKPKRKIDEYPWQKVLDQLYQLALIIGPVWLEMANDSAACPKELNCRDYDCWQPVLSIAKYIQSASKFNAHAILSDHALGYVEKAKSVAIPEEEEILLKALTDLRKEGDRPTSGELLELVKKNAPLSFGNWHPKTVTNRLKQFGINSMKSNCRREFRPNHEQLIAIQISYEIDLGYES